MTDYQKMADLSAQAAKKSPYYWASRVSDQFADVVCDAMEQQNVSRAELARRSGVSRQYITKIMNGYTNFTVESMQKIMVAIGLKIDGISVSALDVVPESKHASFSQWTFPASSSSRSRIEINPDMKPSNDSRFRPEAA